MMYYGKMVDLIDKIPLDLIDEKNMKYLKAAAIVDAIDNGKREQEQIEIDKYESRREYGL